MAPPAVVAAFRGIDEQDQEIERQVARLSGIAEPRLVISRVASQIPVEVDDDVMTEAPKVAETFKRFFKESTPSPRTG